MGRNKSKQVLRQESKDRKITIVYCRQFSVLEIVSVLRNHNESNLWTKTKFEWTLKDWEDYFSLKKLNQI
jgi:hypothetical protein